MPSKTNRVRRLLPSAIDYLQLADADLAELLTDTTVREFRSAILAMREINKSQLEWFLATKEALDDTSELTVAEKRALVAGLEEGLTRMRQQRMQIDKWSGEDDDH